MSIDHNFFLMLPSMPHLFLQEPLEQIIGPVVAKSKAAGEGKKELQVREHVFLEWTLIFMF